MNARQSGAAPEGPTADARHAGRDGDARKAAAILEGIRADVRQLAVFAKGDARKVGATREGIRADARHAGRDGDARKASATREGIRADARHATVRGNNTGFASDY